MIVNIADQVVVSGRVPTILTLYVPAGLNFETKMLPVRESTPTRSLA